jgi:hypothetical protein
MDYGRFSRISIQRSLKRRRTSPAVVDERRLDPGRRLLDRWGLGEELQLQLVEGSAKVGLDRVVVGQGAPMEPLVRPPQRPLGVGALRRRADVRHLGIAEQGLEHREVGRRGGGYPDQYAGLARIGDDRAGCVPEAGLVGSGVRADAGRPRVRGGAVGRGIFAEVAQNAGHVGDRDGPFARLQQFERAAFAQQRGDLRLALFLGEQSPEVRLRALGAGEGGEVPIVCDLIAVGDRHDVIDLSRGPVAAGAVEDIGFMTVADQQAGIEREVPHHLALPALAIGLDDRPDRLDGLTAVRPRSTVSRQRSRQQAPSCSGFWLLKVASLSTATPCSLQPSSAPQVQNDWPRTTSCVTRAWGIVRCVMRTSAPSP